MRPPTAARSRLLADVARAILDLDLSHPARVAIDGPDAAGKTTFADELAATLRRAGRSVVRASIDGFHRAATERRRAGRFSPEGYYRDSFDEPALCEQLLAPLGPAGDQRFVTAAFDLHADQPVCSARQKAPPNAILLFDGVFLMKPALRIHWDFCIFVQASEEVSLRRGVARDRERLGSSQLARVLYEVRYLPGQRIYASACEPAAAANVVVDNDDPAHPRIRWRSRDPLAMQTNAK